MELRRKKLNYMWVIVVACFMLGFVCLGFCSGNKSLYLAATTDALGIKRSLFSVSDSIRYLTTAVVNLFFGSLLHKLGVRKMVAIGVLSLIVQCVLNATAQTIWGFYAAGMFLGLGLACCTTTMISFVIRRWCKENTGKILGFVLAANGIGAAVSAQIVSPMIYQEGNAFGYRTAYLFVAASLAVVGIIVVPLLKEKHDDCVPTQTQKQSKGKSRDWVGMEYEQAKKKIYFYVAAVCIFLTGMCIQGTFGIAAAHMRDTGIDPDYVAKVTSIQSLVLAASKFLAGVSYDRFGMRVTMTICDAAAVVAAVLLTMVGTTVFGLGSAMAYGVVIALAMPLETIMLSLFASELFGNRAFPQTMGVFAAVNVAGYAVGNPIANWVFDTCGTYNPVILAFGLVMLTVLIVFQFILNAAYKQRKQILQAQ